MRRYGSDFVDIVSGVVDAASWQQDSLGLELIRAAGDE